MLAPARPTPLSAFHLSLSTLPRHLPIAEVVVGYEAKEDLRFSETEFDRSTSGRNPWSPTPSVQGLTSRSSGVRSTPRTTFCCGTLRSCLPGRSYRWIRSSGCAGTRRDCCRSRSVVRVLDTNRLGNSNSVVRTGPFADAHRVRAPAQSERGGPPVDLWFTHVSRTSVNGRSRDGAALAADLRTRQTERRR